ncbi:hypothetical protein C7G41_29000 [Bradyrhizobium sp. MOS002]|nr:hypothetical protein C7G41_29000 [Bradyrhizobium sp. MOS002]
MKFVLAQDEDQSIKRKWLTQEQIIWDFEERQAGLPVANLCASRVSARPASQKQRQVRPDGRLGGQATAVAEDKNSKLKRLLAYAMLDNAALKDLLGKW